MTKNIQTLKGFRDFLPKEALQRQWLKNKIISVFEQWGYDPIETPTLEPLELFKGQIGEDEQLFYQFTDNGGRQVALRYDQTVPTCRVVGQYGQQLPMPFRRYQIQSSFRAEKPQKGRYREFTQCDGDIFGVSDATADAETIALSLDIYRQLGFPKAKVLINDREMMKEIPYEAIVAIDKLKKIGEVGVIAEMLKKGIDADKAKQYLTFIINLKPNNTIKTIINYLTKLGFPSDWYAFDPTIARSFSYSTGPIWEVIIPDVPGGSVLGGERYDKLTERVSGQTIPATGFGLGFDRTLEAALFLGLVPDFDTRTQILVTVFNKELLDYSLKISKMLRENGLRVETYPATEDKLSKQIKYADKKGIPYVIIAGENEQREQKVTVKNLKTGEQQTMTISELNEYFI